MDSEDCWNAAAQTANLEEPTRLKEFVNLAIDPKTREELQNMEISSSDFHLIDQLNEAVVEKLADRKTRLCERLEILKFLKGLRFKPGDQIIRNFQVLDTPVNIRQYTSQENNTASSENEFPVSGISFGIYGSTEVMFIPKERFAGNFYSLRHPKILNILGAVGDSVICEKPHLGNLNDYLQKPGNFIPSLEAVLKLMLDFSSVVIFAQENSMHISFDGNFFVKSGWEGAVGPWAFRSIDSPTENHKDNLFDLKVLLKKLLTQNPKPPQTLNPKPQSPADTLVTADWLLSRLLKLMEISSLEDFAKHLKETTEILAKGNDQDIAEFFAGAV